MLGELWKFGNDLEIRNQSVGDENDLQSHRGAVGSIYEYLKNFDDCEVCDLLASSQNNAQASISTVLTKSPMIQL